MASIADNPNPNPNQEPEQSIIPVLTVFKNKSILKNIFIILNNNNDNDDNNNDHTLLVGRHPNCNIVLTHPSISRFHLQIRFTPSSRSISLLDLSSVHGTWVSGRKLEHGVSVELKEGDSFQLGVSSRIYLLHFVSKFDADALKKIGSLSCDDEKKNQSKDATFEVDNDSCGNEKSCCDRQNKLCGCQLCFLSPPYMQSVDESDNTQINEACQDVEMLEETSLLCTLRECFKHNICILGTKLNEQSSAEKQWINPEASSDEKDDAAVDVRSKESDFEVTFEDTDKVEDILTTGASVFDTEDMTDSAVNVISKESDCEVTFKDTDKIEDILTTGARAFDSEDMTDSAVDVISKESDFEVTFEDTDKIEDILTTGARVFDSEDMTDSGSHPTNSDAELSVDSLSDREEQGNCGEKYETELQNLNANCCLEKGYSLNEIVEDIEKMCIENTDPTSFDENGVAAVNVAPREHKLEFFFEENDRIDNILTSVARLFISENTSSPTEEAIPVINFQQIKIVEEVAVDSISDGEKESKGDKELQAYLNVKPCDEEGSLLDEKVEETVISFQTESINPSVTQEPDFEITDKKENQTPQSLVAADGNVDVGILERSCIEESTVEDTVISFQTESLNPSVTQEPDFEITDKKENQTPQLLVAADGNVDVGILERSCIEESTVEDTVMISFQTESLNPSVTQEPDFEITDKKENQTPQSLVAADGNVDVGILERSCIEESTVEDTVMISFQTESLNPSVTQEPDFEITDKKENQTPQSLVAADGNVDVGILERSCIEESAKGSSTFGSDEEGSSLDETDEDTVKSFQTESLNPSVIQDPDLEVTDKKENQSPQSLVAVDGNVDMGILERSCIVESAKGSSTFGSDILSKRDKAASAPQDQTRKSRLLNTPNVDTKFVMSNLKDINITNKPMPKDLFSVLDEEEMFTPTKENSSPTNPFHLQFLGKKGVLEESKSSKSQRSHNLNANFSPIIYSAERSSSAISNKENLTPREALKWLSGRKPLECHDTTELRKKRLERRPLQSLMSSGGNSNSRISSPLSAAKSIVGVTARASNCGHISYKHTEPSSISEERKKSWDMVVDTASLLNKESRKALQLLQGLKGTRLIIPQSVIRELGSIKQQFRIFRKTSEADLALKWIEECMRNTKWWIHIIDCAFPMVEDHVLDCALEYRRKYNVGHVVLLSDDIILKIKSMAKGLLCETVQQFRQSLANPFSERFMWGNSFPRGLTWSCQDDVVLRQKYCCLPSKAGLKLLVT